MKFKTALILILISTTTVQAKKSVFDKNKSSVKSLETIYVLTDTTMIEDMPDKTVGMNLEYNQNLGKELFTNLVELFKGTLKAQFIHSISAVGLYESDNVYIPDYLDSSHKIMLPVIDESIKSPEREAFLHELNPLVDRSYAIVKTRKEKRNYLEVMSDKDFTRMQSLGLKPGEAVLLLIATGVKIPTKKSVGQAVATTILTLGLFTGWQMSANNFNAVLISHDGQLLWTNAYFKGGKVTKDKKQESFLRHLFKTFPVKLNKKRK
jgi:hypothetical protein